MGSDYVLLQKTIQERSAQNNWQTTHTLAYAQNEQDAVIQPLSTNMTLTTQPYELARQVTWSPDSQQVLFMTKEACLPNILAPLSIITNEAVWAADKHTNTCQPRH